MHLLMYTVTLHKMAQCIYWYRRLLIDCIYECMFGDHICEVHYIRAGVLLTGFAEFTLGSLPLDGGGEEPGFLSSVLFEAEQL